jgi:hypothetical protein
VRSWPLRWSLLAGVEAGAEVEEGAAAELPQPGSPAPEVQVRLQPAEAEQRLEQARVRASRSHAHCWARASRFEQ